MSKKEEALNLLEGAEDNQDENALDDIDEIESEEPADDDGEDDNDGEGEQKPPDLKEQIATIKETIQEKAEKIEETREEFIFLSKQLEKPDKAQFEKGGLFEDLPTYYLDNVLLYLATDDQIDSAIAQIEGSQMSSAEKRSTIRTIDKAISVYQDRQKQYEKHLSKSLENVNVQEWQQIELSFTDAKNGIKGMDKHIKEIWEFCKEKMAGSRALKAKCETGYQAKLDLAVRAIRELEIDKKLAKDEGGDEVADIEVPVGKTGSTGKRGNTKGPSFTRSQLKEYAKNPSKLSDEMWRKVNEAVAGGRIKNK